MALDTCLETFLRLSRFGIFLDTCLENHFPAFSNSLSLPSITRATSAGPTKTHPIPLSLASPTTLCSCVTKTAVFPLYKQPPAQKASGKTK